MSEASLPISSRGIISTTGNKGIEEISCKHPLGIGGTTWIHNDLEIYNTLRSMFFFNVSIEHCNGCG